MSDLTGVLMLVARLTYLGPFITCSIAAMLCGPLTDYITRRMAKANKGIFEPGGTQG